METQELDKGIQLTAEQSFSCSQAEDNKTVANKSFPCPQCGKSFTQKGNLRIHFRIHTGEKPFQSHPVRQEFHRSKKSQRSPALSLWRKSASLRPVWQNIYVCSTPKSHLRIHANDKPCLCSICGQIYSSMDHFKEHQKVHANVCSECGSSFNLASHLKEHYKLHTGEKPYTCSHCGKSFSQPGSLRKHERIHTGVKPYICPSCGRPFCQSSALLYHIRKHCPKLEKNK